ncbi:MAG TPA: DegT/DnrJ/EryC1/StrS family aminotransferase [Terriglobales bacterium]|jgi:dTDP-4-amino-4,6-dideoxygalactose transaminase|nr:DegT/DnrJ/EryC1/StrS family aminotransferase [Terriglobales bacterium]
MTTSAVRLEVPFVDLKAQYNSIKEEVLDSVRRVFDSGHFVGGEYVEKFEEEFARFAGAKYAVGVSSGTSALELALKAANVAPGDEVIVPANSFFATAEAVSNVGAVPVFADVDPKTFHLDISAVERRISKKTRAVIPVHLYGYAMDLTQLEQICERHRLELIEDAAQAHGVGRNGTRVGAAGRLTCFSFYPGKNLGAYGDAGAVTCNDLERVRQLRILREHGSPAKYQHSVVGTNARLDAVQAAILSVKLPYLEGWNSLRVRHAKRYAAAFAGSKVVAPAIPADGEHNFHLFVVRVGRRDSVKDHLQQCGIQSGIHYPVPLHLTGAYQDLGHPGAGSMPVTEKLASEILSLPMYPELSQDQIGHVARTLLDFIN